MIKQIKHRKLNLKGFGPGWHLKEIIIETTNNKVIFPCNKWFDKKENDGKIERFLYPIDSIKTFNKKFSHELIGS
jgi:hypothetical protein